jgi:hypothetical protein
MRKPKSRKAATKKKAPVKLPDWMNTKMQDMNYKLEIMCGCGDCNTEVVDLTRDEYIALKHHLAKMRGFAIPKAAA